MLVVQHVNCYIRGITQLKLVKRINSCLNYFTSGEVEGRFTKVAFSSCWDSWRVRCAEGGGEVLEEGWGPGDTVPASEGLSVLATAAGLA